MQKMLVTLLLAVLVGPAASVAPARADGGLVSGAVITIASELLPRILPDCCPVGICGSRTWLIRYADGLTLANEVRLCRTADDIANAASGYGDCDWRDAYGNSVCLNSRHAAQALINTHGEVVEMIPLN